MTTPTDAGSTVERLVAVVAESEIFRTGMPAEAAVGWPLPLRRQGHLCVRLPVIEFRPVAGQGSELLPPVALFTVLWPDGRIIEYRDLRFDAPWPVDTIAAPVGAFPHGAVRDSLRDYVTDRALLLASYDRLLNDLGAGRPSSADDELRDLLGRLIEPDLVPYYRALAPKFMERFGPPDRTAGTASR